MKAFSNSENLIYIGYHLDVSLYNKTISKLRENKTKRILFSL